jgi:hypothetical protein
VKEIKFKTLEIIFSLRSIIKNGSQAHSPLWITLVNLLGSQAHSLLWIKFVNMLGSNGSRKSTDFLAHRKITIFLSPKNAEHFSGIQLFENYERVEDFETMNQKP